jgi:hypothetical protein
MISPEGTQLSSPEGTPLGGRPQALSGATTHLTEVVTIETHGKVADK